MASRTTLYVALAAAVSFGALEPSAATTTFRPRVEARSDRSRASRARDGSSAVIIRAVDGASLDAVGPAIAQAGGVAGRRLRIINARAAVVPNAALHGLSHNPFIAQIVARSPGAGDDGAHRRDDRRAGGPPGARLRRRRHRRRDIDSGVASWHEDLTGANGQRVSEFVDFVNGRDDALRRLRPRDARRRHRRGKRIRLGRRADGDRARRRS